MGSTFQIISFLLFRKGAVKLCCEGPQKTPMFLGAIIKILKAFRSFFSKFIRLLELILGLKDLNDPIEGLLV